MVDASLPPDIAALSFEDALQELEQIVKRLEEGKSKLDDAISSYERGALLKRHCEEQLAKAQARVDRSVRGADGALATQPFGAAGDA
jgi:exodeoxyribonuclease VII small subunit